MNLDEVKGALEHRNPAEKGLLCFDPGAEMSSFVPQNPPGAAAGLDLVSLCGLFQLRSVERAIPALMQRKRDRKELREFWAPSRACFSFLI